MARDLPSQSTLHELLEYDPVRGVLFWRQRDKRWFKDSGRGGAAANAKRWNAEFAGKPALSSATQGGYLKGRLIDRTVLAHRVIYKFIHGFDAIDIDHIDGNRANNRIDNLRSVKARENQRNRCIPNTNKSGQIGVCWDKYMRKWKSYARDDRGKIKHLGYFDDVDAAASARASVDESLGYHPNHGRASAPCNAAASVRMPLGRAG